MSAVDPSNTEAETPATATASSAHQQHQQQQQQHLHGIDIHKALDILAARSSTGHDHSHSHSNDVGCHAHQTEDKRFMGQTIDLESPTTSSGATTAQPQTTVEQQQQQQQNDTEAIRKEQEARRQQLAKELEVKLKSMSVKELLQTVMETQQQRVSTYTEYNGSLQQVLDSGNMSTYMNGCAHATAAFAVLSETIIAIRKALVETHKRKDLETMLTNLQSHEKEKLNLTAALHLERIREKNENVGNVGGADKRISRLLSEGVKSLQGKVASCIEEINEVLEEMRYALLEEEEEN